MSPLHATLIMIHSPRLLTHPVARLFYHSSVLGAEVSPKMQRNKSKAVPRFYDPVSHDDYVYSRLAIDKLSLIVAEELDKSVKRSTSHFDNERLEDKEEKNKNNQRLAGLASSSTATSRHGGRRRNKHDDSQAYGGRCSRSSEARGYLFYPG